MEQEKREFFPLFDVLNRQFDEECWTINKSKVMTTDLKKAQIPTNIRWYTHATYDDWRWAIIIIYEIIQMGREIHTIHTNELTQRNETTMRWNYFFFAFVFEIWWKQFLRQMSTSFQKTWKFV